MLFVQVGRFVHSFVFCDAVFPLQLFVAQGRAVSFALAEEILSGARVAFDALFEHLLQTTSRAAETFVVALRRKSMQTFAHRDESAGIRVEKMSDEHRKSSGGFAENVLVDHRSNVLSFILHFNRRRFVHDE